MLEDFRRLPHSRTPTWHPIVLVRGPVVRVRFAGCHRLLRVYKGGGTPYNAPMCRRPATGRRLKAQGADPLVPLALYPAPRAGRVHGSGHYTVGEMRWLIYNFQPAGGTRLGCVLSRCSAQVGRCMRSSECRLYSRSTEGERVLLANDLWALYRAPWYVPWVNESWESHGWRRDRRMGGVHFGALQRCFAFSCSLIALDTKAYRSKFSRALSDVQMEAVLTLAASMHPRYIQRRKFGLAHNDNGSEVISKGHRVTYLHSRFQQLEEV